jgi:ABC-type sugar transport system ATPase subunit
MGRTGCGKTTLLEAIAGLKPVRSGSIRIGNVDVTDERPAARGIGYVPQDCALFSSMTVREHLAFALEIRRIPESRIEQRVDEVAEWLGIGHLLTRHPFGLSGGERQRVAIGRALSFHPEILLMDEPLSGLDEETRGEMYELLHKVRTDSGVTVLHVTHHPDDATELADVLYHLRDGALREEAPGTDGLNQVSRSHR